MVLCLFQVPRGETASVCFKTGLSHLEQNQLADALSCLDEAFLALAKDQSRGADIKAQATICAQYKIAVAILKVFAFRILKSYIFVCILYHFWAVFGLPASLRSSIVVEAVTSILSFWNFLEKL